MDSLRALQLPALAQSDYLHLRYRPDVHIVAARWQRAVSSEELRAGYAATLATAQAACCSFWLVDVRGRASAEAADARWLTTEFLPQLAARMESGVYLGFLVSPNFPWPAMAQVPFHFAPLPPPSLRSFSDEGALTQWLAECQRRAQASAAAGTRHGAFNR